MIRAAAVLAALLGLGVARLLPETGVGLYVRLVAATIVLVLPGALIARALALRGLSAAFVWTLTAVCAASAVMFAVEGSLSVVLVLLAVFGLVALPFPLRREALPREPGTPAVLALGVLFGAALWRVAGVLEGDALFHLARVRKLDAFDSLSLEAVGEFADGGLHPGYAFPLWHTFVALLARLAGVDPAAVFQHGASVLAPLALVVVYEAGVALFRSAWMAVAVVAAQVALVGLAAGHGGSYTALAQPGTAARQLVIPALLALVFAYIAEPSRALVASVAAGALVLALVHPTYALFVTILLAGFWLARALIARTDVRELATCLLAVAVPSAAVAAWLLPVVRETASHSPAPEELRRALAQYAGQIDVFSERSYRLAPEVFGRGGAVAVAALVLIPLAALASQRRWAAFVLGGSLAILAVMLLPWIFSPFADAVSLSQARRAAGFLPFAFAFAGGLAVLGRIAGIGVVPLALAAGLALQIRYPGDFGYTLEEGGPALATWIAAIGGAAALVAAVVRQVDAVERPGVRVALAAVLFVVPVAAQALASWSPRPARSQVTLTPGVIAAVRERVSEDDVVFADLETSYRLAAAAPVYVAAAPPGHVANTAENRPYDRRRDVLEFLRTGDLRIPRRYGADWLLVDDRRFSPDVELQASYSDGAYSLYRLG